MLVGKLAQNKGKIALSRYRFYHLYSPFLSKNSHLPVGGTIEAAMFSSLLNEQKTTFIEVQNSKLDEFQFNYRNQPIRMLFFFRCVPIDSPHSMRRWSFVSSKRLTYTQKEVALLLLCFSTISLGDCGFRRKTFFE